MLFLCCARFIVYGRLPFALLASKQPYYFASSGQQGADLWETLVVKENTEAGMCHRDRDKQGQKVLCDCSHLDVSVICRKPFLYPEFVVPGDHSGVGCSARGRHRRLEWGVRGMAMGKSESIAGRSGGCPWGRAVMLRGGGDRMGQGGAEGNTEPVIANFVAWHTGSN